MKNENMPWDIALILQIVSESKNIEVERILAKDKKGNDKVLSRHYVHKLCKELTKHTNHDIGFYVGRKDHSSISHAIKTINNLVDTDKTIRQEYNALYNLCSSALDDMRQIEQTDNYKLENTSNIVELIKEIKRNMEYRIKVLEDLKHVFDSQLSNYKPTLQISK